MNTNNLMENKADFYLRIRKLLDSISSTSLVNTPLTENLCCSLYDALHLFYEDCKLCKDTRGKCWVIKIGTLLAQIANKSKKVMGDFLDYYRRDLGCRCETLSVGLLPAGHNNSVEYFCRLSKFSRPPSFFDWIDCMLKGNLIDGIAIDSAYSTTSPLELNSSCISTRKIHRFFNILCCSDSDLSQMIINNGLHESDDSISSTSMKLRLRDQLLALAMVEEGVENISSIVHTFPTGIALPLVESLYRCKNDPPPTSENWSPSFYSCTLDREPADIAALLMAFFPRYPAETSDNQYHLQALRHCYVLAVRHRAIEAIDVDSREPVFAALKVRVEVLLCLRCFQFFSFMYIFKSFLCLDLSSLNIQMKVRIQFT